MNAHGLRRAFGFASAIPRPSPEGPEDGPRIDATLTAFAQPVALRAAIRRDRQLTRHVPGRLVRFMGPEAPPAPLGLSGGSEFGHPVGACEARTRYGWNGLTGSGRRKVRQIASALQTRRRDCVFWTITLPSEIIYALAKLDTWHIFQDHIRRYLRRKLIQRGLGGELVGVAEIQMERTVRDGELCPHLHIIYIGKKSGKKCWAIHYTVLDRIISRALEAAGIRGADVTAAGQVERVKASCAGYLAKYMSKGGRLAEESAARFLEALPRQWWFRSKEAALLEVSLSGFLPARFALAMLDWDQLGRLPEGLAVERVPIPDPRAPSCWAIHFQDPEALLGALELWAGNANWWQTGGNHCFEHGGPLPL